EGGAGVELAPPRAVHRAAGDVGGQRRPVLGPPQVEGEAPAVAQDYVGGAVVVPAAQVERRVEGDQPAAVQHRDAVADRFDLVHVVRRQQDGRAAGGAVAGQG